MTDRPTRPSDEARDELVSAVLDGEATEAERAAVAADPTLRERLETLRSVREGLRAVAAAQADELAAGTDDRIAAALGAAGTGPTTPSGTTPSGTVRRATVRSLSATRSATAPRRRRAAAIGGVAAALVLVAGAIGLGLRAGSDDSDDAATAAGGAAEDAGASEESGAAERPPTDEDLDGSSPPGAAGSAATDDRSGALATTTAPLDPSEASAAGRARRDLAGTAGLPDLGVLRAPDPAAVDRGRLAVRASDALPCPSLVAPPRPVLAAVAQLGDRTVLVVADGDDVRVVLLDTCTPAP